MELVKALSVAQLEELAIGSSLTYKVVGLDKKTIFEPLSEAGVCPSKIERHIASGKPWAVITTYIEPGQGGITFNNDKTGEQHAHDNHEANAKLIFQLNKAGLGGIQTTRADIKLKLV